jgi:hypothetical protein
MSSGKGVSFMVDKTKKAAKNKGLTRARAEALIAKVTNPDELQDERFTKHANGF